MEVPTNLENRNYVRPDVLGKIIAKAEKERRVISRLEEINERQTQLLVDQLSDFANVLEARNRGEKYIRDVRSFISKVATDQKWQCLRRHKTINYRI